jgi:hypothetical protein
MVQRVTLDFKTIAEKTKRKIETVFHEFTQDMAEEVIVATPWLTGNLRASWFPSINTPGAVPPGVSPDPSGAATIARLSVEIPKAKIGDRIYIMNGASYAKFVEFGTANMAPRAFVRKTLNRAPKIAERTIQRIAKK